MKRKVYLAFFLVILISLSIAMVVSCGDDDDDDDVVADDDDNDDNDDDDDDNDDDSTESGSVKGLVTDENGAPLDDVDVTVLGQTEGAFSDADGVFEITDLATADNLNLMFEKDGYASNWKSTAVYGGVASTVRVAMKTRVTAVTFDATADFSKSFGNNKITIPANSLESGKAPFTGTATIMVTPIDLFNDSPDVIPGYYENLDEDGENAMLDKYALAEVIIQDDSGNSLTIADGFGVTLELRLPDTGGKFQEGDTISAWNIDETSGEWVEIAQGQVGAAFNKPSALSWTVDISTSTKFEWYGPYWGGFVHWHAYCYRGIIKTKDGTPIPGAWITSKSTVPWEGGACDKANGDGEFCVLAGRDRTNIISVTFFSYDFIPYSFQVVTPDVNSLCAPGACENLGDVEIDVASCVEGTLEDLSGAAMPLKPVWSSQGAATITDTDGNFCISAYKDDQVTLLTGSHHPGAVTPTGDASCYDKEDSCEPITLTPFAADELACLKGTYDSSFGIWAVNVRIFDAGTTNMIAQTNADGTTGEYCTEVECGKVVDVAVCGEYPGLIENVVLNNCGESCTDPYKCYTMPDFWDDIGQGWPNASTHCQL